MLFRLLLISLATVACARWNMNPSTYSFRFGKFDAKVINDGNVVFKKMLFDIPSVSVERAAQENRRSVNPIIVGLNQLLVDTGSNRILVDAGAANVPEFAGTCLFDKAGLSLGNMKRAGILPDSIDSVLLTHGHPDHLGGLTTKDGKMIFPNATVYISRKDHEFWMNRSITEMNNGIGFMAENRAVYQKNVLPYLEAGRLSVVEMNESPIEGVRFLATPGHTVGHCCIEFTSEGKQMIFTGDVFRTKWDQLQHPEWRLGIDSDANVAIESRIAFLERANSRGDLLISAHENFPGLGYVRKLGPFFDWTIADYQLSENDSGLQ